MQIDLIDTFLDLVETRSFNRTAERMGVTQSTVSARVSALEKAVGRRLFARSRAGTALTFAGIGFEPHARALRHGWRSALRAAGSAGKAALSVRIGLQSDLAGAHIGAWVTEFRSLLPETDFYLELDYSTQMCIDLIAGNLDLAILYTPRPGPDLHFESIGEMRYRLISSDGPNRADITPERYIRASYSPAFDRQHETLLLDLSEAPVACGHDAAVSGLLTELGGAAYVLETTATRLIAQNGFDAVQDAPDIPQTLYAAIHVRHRHEHVHQKLLAIIRRQFGNPGE